MKIKTAARSSELSRAQVKEVDALLKEASLSPVFVETYGDIDRETSLRSLPATDFFTKEVDELLLKNVCRLAIHSAKDLPEKLPDGLMVAALTKCIDPRDSLVVKSLETLPDNALIATSSLKREEAVKQILPNARFCDLRGTIAERLSLLDNNLADGVVVAEAALLRLGYEALPRLFLPGKTTAGQGQLALVIKQDDLELLDILKPLDSCSPL